MIATTLVAVLLLLVAFIARRLRSDLEEAAWRLMSVVMLVMPLASLLPKAEVTILLPLIHAEADFITRPRYGDAAGSLLAAFAPVYTVTALVLLGRLAVGVAAAARLRRDAEPFGNALISSSLRVPVTAGLFAPAILLPVEARTWSETKLAAVLAHERAHVVRRDPLWRFIGRAASAICWFHPLAWLAGSSIERLAEEAADSQAVAAIGDRHQYADVVLDILRVMTDGHRRVFASGMLDARDIGRRIASILTQPPRHRAGRGSRLLLAGAIIGAMFVTGMTAYQPPEPDPAQFLATVIEQPLTREEFFRKRGEMRNRFRKDVRETVQGFFRDSSSN